jgi:hypothetical protein
MKRLICITIVAALTMPSCERRKEVKEIPFPNYRISSLTNLKPNEITVAVNPVNPLNIIVGSNNDWIYSSSTGGTTWTEDVLAAPVLGVRGDPVVLFDHLGNAYYGHLSNPEGPAVFDRIVVQKSTDGGQSWNEGIGVGLNGSSRLQDKEWIEADMTNSVYKGNLYMAWTEFDKYGSKLPEDKSRIRFSYSSNQSETWSEPIVISDTEGDCLDDDNTMEGAVPAAGPEGQIYIAWSGPQGIYFDKSLDGGKTFGTDKILSDIPGGWAFSVPEIYRCNGMPFTVCDVSGSEYRGNIYVLWSDQRNGNNNTDVFLIKSSDGGNTWSSRKKVNDDKTQTHQFFPNITVDPVTGYVYIVYYDRSRTGTLNTEVRLSRSIDGGDTFTSYKVSKDSFLPTANVFFGDYIDVTAYNGYIYPAWMTLNEGTMAVMIASIHESDFEK